MPGGSRVTDLVSHSSTQPPPHAWASGRTACCYYFLLGSQAARSTHPYSIWPAAPIPPLLIWGWSLPSPTCSVGGAKDELHGHQLAVFATLPCG